MRYGSPKSQPWSFHSRHT